MGLKHKVSISVGRRENGVIRSGSRTMRSKLLKLLFGEKVGVFVLTPGKTVKTVEIREMAEGGDDNVKNG
jgi:hypothetical protein